MGELSLNSFETNATLHYHHFLPLLHITVYLNPSRRVAADDLNVCAPVFMLLPVAMYFSGFPGALAGEHLQICLVIRNTCFSDGPLSMLQIPIFFVSVKLQTGRWVVSILKPFSFC